MNKLTATVLATAALAAACTAPREEAAPQPPAPVEAPITCILLAPALNSQVWDDLTFTWGELDYEGNTIYAVDHDQAVVGYAAEEDGPMWNLPQCLEED